MTRLGPFFFCYLAAVSLGMVALSLSSRGHPVTLPLDDAYIYFQYARTALEGSPGEYVAGEGTSTGATSPLWTGLLIGAGGVLEVLGRPLATGLPFAALVLSMLTVGLMFFLSHHLARRHGTGPAGASAPLLVLLLTPYWLFAGFNGMETGLYAATLLGGARALSGGSAWWLVPLALARPEGAVLAMVLLLVIRISRARRVAEPTPWRTILAFRVVPVVAAAALLGPLALSGQPLSAWEAKAVWTEADPELRDFHFPRLPWFAAKILLFEIQGARPLSVETLSGFLTPVSRLLWTGFLGGGMILALVARRGRGPLILWVLASLAALTALAWDAHFYRYVMPAYPLLAVAAAVGWFGRRSRGEDTPPRRSPGRLLPVLGGLLLAGLVITGWTKSPDLWTTTRRLYRGQCEQMAETQVRLGKWLDRSLPETARVATHDVGAVAFHGRRPVVDLVGLVTPELAGAYRQGEGAIWEALEALPSDRRPTHAAVIPAWMPYLSRSKWSGRTVWKQNPRESARPVSQSFQVWELSWPDRDAETWPGGDFSRTPREHGIAAGKPGWIVTDAVDIADLGSEREHDYEGAPTSTLVRTLGFERTTAFGRKSPAVDGGREIAGPVSFSLKVRAGLPALLVLRCTSTSEGTATVSVGEWSGELTIPRGEERFHEPAIWIPPQAFTPREDGRDRIRIEGARMRAFHWWLLQPDPGE